MVRHEPAPGTAVTDLRRKVARLIAVRAIVSTMLLVFGVRYLYSLVATGTFHCPVCGLDRSYRLRAPRAWFHLFWIPLVPLRPGAPVVDREMGSWPGPHRSGGEGRRRVPGNAGPGRRQDRP